ncbi:MAG TPA: 3-dehydroquinate synthase [Phycisphaerae bacterium]|nr:3-dehydroquinate synthase [Phycisphaerae bacterium]
MARGYQTVTVPLRENGYTVTIGDGLLAEMGTLMERWRGRRACIITDSNVAPLYANALGNSLTATTIRSHVLTVPAGEDSKSLQQAGRLYDELAAIHHERDEPIIALGGGVVGDLAGFVAATWMRGVPFIQCPTSLEADVDASVGGKAAINHAAGKNLIGAFHQPAMVCIDVACLKTLEARDFTAALSESVKHAILSGEEFLAWHERNVDEILARQPAVMTELIRRNCEVKAGFVAMDERETASEGIGRAALNLGHTIGHALESASGGTLRHGEAVGMGLLAAMEAGVRWAGFPREDQGRCTALLRQVGHPVKCAQPPAPLRITELIGADKKVREGLVRLVIPTRLGEVIWRNGVSADELLDLLAWV